MRPIAIEEYILPSVVRDESGEPRRFLDEMALNARKGHGGHRPTLPDPT